MYFLTLSLDNFGVFRGRHSFELAPYFRNDQWRRLTIFSGQNGAGKTTIFQAMKLALHGSYYFGDLANPQNYHSFIRSRMHHHSAGLNSADVHDSAVELRFRYVQSGQHFDIQVERRWSKHEHAVKETLNVLKDGQPPDIDPADYQTWIDDLVPPGIGSLCFFDAEQLDALANQDQQSKVLSETLNRLLGLDWAQYLETDLDLLKTRHGSTKKIENLYTKVLELQSERDKLEDQLNVLRRQLDEVNSGISHCEYALTQQERRLATEGGVYAARRPVLEEQLRTIQKETETLSSQMHDLCTHLLPFALAPELCLQLSKRLSAEIEVRRRQALNALLLEKLPEIESTLADEEIWKELDILPDGRKYLTQRLMERLKSFTAPQSSHEAVIAPHLSEPEHEQLRRWIFQSIHDIPQQVQQLGDELRILKEKRQRITSDLQRAPDDEVLAPIHIEIERLRGNLLDMQKRQTALNGQIGSLEFQRDEKRRMLQEAIDQYDQVRKNEKQLKYAERTRNVLRTYKDALTRQKLHLLEDALITCFNKICHKEHLLSKVSIDPVDLSIELKTVGGIALKLSDFSAGERQLYAMSLLWALRLVSKLPLPLAIDTPLARLDETHRTRLIHDYIPQVSDQVLLFATDAEIDTNLLHKAGPELARIYQLNYKPLQGETIVTCSDESFSRDIDLSLLDEKVNAHGI